MTTVARFFMLDGNFLKSLWGGMLSTAVSVANRSPHNSLGSKTLSFKVHDKNADMSALRAISVRAFVHTETDTSKVEDRA